MGQLLQFMGLCHTAAILSRETKVALFYLSSIAPKFFTARSRVVRQSFCSLSGSLRSKRLKVVGTRKNGRARRRHSRDRPSRVPVLSFTHYFQTPATQAILSGQYGFRVNMAHCALAV